MPIISLVGCNAIGKTTALLRYIAKYPALVAAEADTQRVYKGSEVIIEKGWKGTRADKGLLVNDARSEITLVASARNDHLEFVLDDEPVIIVTCHWKLYEANMQARCAAKGKKYRHDYWTPLKLQYESGRRYTNWAEKNLLKSQVTHFDLQSYADWDKIDAEFSRIYRRLHNEMVRNR